MRENSRWDAFAIWIFWVALLVVVVLALIGTPCRMTSDATEASRELSCAPKEAFLWGFVTVPDTIPVWLGSILSALGLFLVWQTLAATRKSAEAAAEAARAAAATNELAERRFVREQRPWMQIRIDPINVQWEDGLGYLRVRCRTANVGRTPAMNTVVKVECIGLNLGNEEAINIATSRAADIIGVEDRNSGSVYFPDGTTVVAEYEVLICREVIEEEKRWGFLPHVVAIVTYRDGNDDSIHFTLFSGVVVEGHDGAAFALIHGQAINAGRLTFLPGMEFQRLT